MSQPQEFPPDVVRGNVSSEAAFNTAVKFYELDHTLTKEQRQKLADAYNSISYTTLAAGWTGFIGAASVPFLLNRLEVNKESLNANKGLLNSVKIVAKPKGRANMGLAIILGIASMTITTPFASSYAYYSQLNNMKTQDSQCAQLMDMLKPSETMKWWLYYTMTVEKPEYIMKDPRTQEAYKRRMEKEGKSAIYSNGKDVFGLYSGPAHEMSEIEKQKKAGLQDRYDDDPFENKKVDHQEYVSAWDKIRSEKSSSSSSSSYQNNPSGSTWSKIRSGGFSSSNVNDNSQQPETDSFEEMLELERHSNDEKENKRW